MSPRHELLAAACCLRSSLPITSYSHFLPPDEPTTTCLSLTSPLCSPVPGAYPPGRLPGSPPSLSLAGLHRQLSSPHSPHCCLNQHLLATFPSPWAHVPVRPNNPRASASSGSRGMCGWRASGCCVGCGGLPGVGTVASPGTQGVPRMGRLSVTGGAPQLHA